MSRRTLSLIAAVATVATIVAAGPVRAQFSPQEPAVESVARVASSVVEQLDQADSSQLLRVFVRAEDAPTTTALVADAGLHVVETFEQVGIVVAVGLPSQIQHVVDDERLVHLDADGPARVFLDTSHEATRGADVMSGVDLTSSAGTSSHHYDGSGVSVAIIDSGVDGTHPFLAGKDGASKVAVNLKLACHDLVGSVDCQAAWLGLDDSDTPSLGGHGTHVAGIVGGSRTQVSDGRVISGAAPGATLVSLSTGAAVSIFGGASGLNWVLEHHDDPCGDGSCPPIRVVNNSWGSTGDHDPGSAISVLTNALVEAGVVVVFAQGNDGGDGTDNVSNPYAQNPTPGVLGIASYDDQGVGTRNGAVSDFSSRGQTGRPQTYPDLSAPGSDVLSSCRVHLPICRGVGDGLPEMGDYGIISGTSMAAPHVAGIVAQLFEAAARNEIALSPAMVEDVLEDTAHAFGAGAAYEWDATNPDTGTSVDKGHGLVDAVAAVARLLGASAPVGTSECVAGAPVLVDAAGDAHNALGQALPVDSVPSLDIIRGEITEWDTVGDGLTDSLRFTVTVEDLTEDPPAGTLGEYFDWNFELDGASYYIGMGWDRTDQPHFLVGNFGGEAGTRSSVLDLEGRADVESDTFVTYLPFDALHEALDGEPPIIVAGTVLGGHEIVSRYDLAVLVPDNDSATGACPYTVGVGAVPPTEQAEIRPPVPGELPAGDADARVHPGGQATFVAPPGTALAQGVGADVGVTADTSETYTVDLLADGESPVVVRAVSDQPGIQDIDLTVISQDGTAHTAADLGGDESVEFTSSQIERITITVTRATTVEAGFQVTVSLG